ncbi:MAG TPA: hypothetical protein VLC79_09380 [Cellvibrio sp.]|nr:hypothetical protein [Cellvibrio sp.]
MIVLLKRVLFFMIVISSGCVANNSENSYQSFWEEFRVAVLADDYRKLEKLTQFPLEVKGVDDSMPIVQYKKEQFQAVFQKIMAQPMKIPHEDTLIETTMRGVVDKTTTVSVEVGYDEQGVEQLVFQNVKGKWLLVRAYLDE